jgi:hypothetical protein
MLKKGLILSLFCTGVSFASPSFTEAKPYFKGRYEVSGAKLCATAQQTLAYLNKGFIYDPQVIHEGKVAKISLDKIKATLKFICQHQSELNNPQFVKDNFDFIRWYPDIVKAKTLAAHKTLLQNLPQDRILMTKYYVHLAKVSVQKNPQMPYPLYGLPQDEQGLTVEEADTHPNLTRFKYGKQAILHGSLTNHAVPILAYVSRDDLESALLQGTLVANFGKSLGTKIFNVHRSNNIAYDPTKGPYEQERFWYFKQVDGIKGYGKDAEHKISVNPEVTFAADLVQLGLGKLLLIQYPDKSGDIVSKAGILADTGGAFADNLYQVDYLAGSYPGKGAFNKASYHLPDYVTAYFMVLKTH